MILDGVAAFKFLLSWKPAHFWAVMRAHLSFYSYLPTFIHKRKKWASHLKYAKVTSIIWQYFMKRRRYYEVLKK